MTSPEETRCWTSASFGREEERNVVGQQTVLDCQFFRKDYADLGKVESRFLGPSRANQIGCGSVGCDLRIQRPDDRDLVLDRCELRHQLANLVSGHGCLNRPERAASFQTRFRIPHLELARTTCQPDE